MDRGVETRIERKELKRIPDDRLHNLSHPTVNPRGHVGHPLKFSLLYRRYLVTLGAGFAIPIHSGNRKEERMWGEVKQRKSRKSRFPCETQAA